MTNGWTESALRLKSKVYLVGAETMVERKLKKVKLVGYLNKLVKEEKYERDIWWSLR